MIAKTATSSLRVLSQLFGGPPGPVIFKRLSAQLGNRYSPLALPYHYPREEQPQLPNGCFDALAILLFKGRGVVGVVDTVPESKFSPEDFKIRLFEIVIVNRVEDPRHKPVH